MRNLPSIALIFVALAGSLALPSLSPLAGSLAMVALGALVSLSTLREWSAWCVVAGAAGALAFAAVGPHSLSLGAACFLLAVFIPRAVRARSRVGAAAIAALAFAGGAIAELLVLRQAAVDPSTWPVALAMGAVLVCTALLPSTDDGVAFALRSLAWRSHGATKRQLLRAVAIRRRHTGMSRGLSRTGRKRIRKAWHNLVRAAELRVEGTRAHAVLDERIHVYVKALQRATRAASDATHLTAAMEDAVLGELRLEQEGLSARVDAMQEVQGMS